MRGVLISVNVLFLIMAVVGFVKDGFTFSSYLWGVFMLVGAVVCSAIFLHYGGREVEGWLE